MKLFLTILLLVVLIGSCGSRDQEKRKAANDRPQRATLADGLKKDLSDDASVIVLINARIVDGTGRRVLHDRTVVIENGRFHMIGHSNSVPIPTNAEVIDVQGRTLIPGLVGIHDHLHIPGNTHIGRSAAKMYLAAGVTTIQTCGAADADFELALARSIEKGEAVGPEVVTSGPYLTGPGGSLTMIIPRDESHIRDTMQHWIDQGCRWFKVYRHIRAEDLKIIVDVAHANDAKVTGHLCSLTFEEAISLGIDGIEHGFNSAADFRTDKEVGECTGDRAYMDDLDLEGEEVGRLLQILIDERVFLTSTPAIYESSVPQGSFADERTLLALSPQGRSEYLVSRKSQDRLLSDSTRLHRLARILRFERRFVEMGGLLGAGVDAGRHNLFGFGDQRNFELLVEAGHGVEGAMKIMTGNGALILGRKDIGTIEIGKRADFVILNGDLTEDPSVIRLVDSVFKKGIGYDPSTLLRDVEGCIGPE